MAPFQMTVICEMLIWTIYPKGFFKKKQSKIPFIPCIFPDKSVFNPPVSNQSRGQVPCDFIQIKSK